MAALPVVSGARAVKAFERAGWRRDQQTGSHIILLKAGSVASLSVPQYREPGTLRSLIRASGLTVDEFVILLP